MKQPDLNQMKRFTCEAEQNGCDYLVFDFIDSDRHPDLEKSLAARASAEAGHFDYARCQNTAGFSPSRDLEFWSQCEELGVLIHHLTAAGNYKGVYFIAENECANLLAAVASDLALDGGEAIEFLYINPSMKAFELTRIFPGFLVLSDPYYAEPFQEPYTANLTSNQKQVFNYLKDENLPGLEKVTADFLSLGFDEKKPPVFKLPDIGKPRYYFDLQIQHRGLYLYVPKPITEAQARAIAELGASYYIYLDEYKNTGWYRQTEKLFSAVELPASLFTRMIYDRLSIIAEWDNSLPGSFSIRRSQDTYPPFTDKDIHYPEPIFLALESPEAANQEKVQLDREEHELTQHWEQAFSALKNAYIPLYKKVLKAMNCPYDEASGDYSHFQRLASRYLSDDMGTTVPDLDMEWANYGDLESGDTPHAHARFIREYQKEPAALEAEYAQALSELPYYSAEGILERCDDFFFDGPDRDACRALLVNGTNAFDRLCEKAADNPDILALKTLCQLFGWGCKNTPYEETAQLYAALHEASEKGSGLGAYFEGLLRLSDNQFPEAAEAMRRSWELGFSDAAFGMVFYYSMLDRESKDRPLSQEQLVREQEAWLQKGLGAGSAACCLIKKSELPEGSLLLEQTIFRQWLHIAIEAGDTAAAAYREEAGASGFQL
ncbi:hypothetical protein [Eubacterium sp. 1001713B170207_170306_E7]|uniref:hypothetical protein n=1 Tax=Eubacterium sp. 1001713B170207_170306_E7 TaxID=2787097 RepID=UPI0018999C2E|nr:hypothetical protein [Eubacterium sp. 1001713B170207_170306_E7]